MNLEVGLVQGLLRLNIDEYASIRDAYTVITYSLGRKYCGAADMSHLWARMNITVTRICSRMIKRAHMVSHQLDLCTSLKQKNYNLYSFTSFETRLSKRELEGVSISSAE